MWGKIYLVFIVMFLIIPISFAVTINPPEYTISKPVRGEDYSVIITAINPDSNKYELTATISENSKYLANDITIQPSSISLEPNSRKNIALKLSIPESMSPQPHIAIIEFKANNIPVGKFTLYFTLTGEQILDYDLSDFTINADNNKEPIFFNLIMSNNGNVNILPTPRIDIFKHDEKIDTFGEKSTITLLPETDMNVSIMYDPKKLTEDGLYTARASLIVPEQTDIALDRVFTIEIIPDFSEPDLITIKKGEKLEFSEKVTNPSDGLSFYRIDYKLENINATLEGEITERRKQIPIVIDTSNFTPGSYNLSVDILYGPRLEELRSKNYIIKIKDKNKLFLPLLTLPIILLLGFFCIKYSYKYLHKTNNQLDNLISESNLISKSFNNIDKDISAMRHDITKFVQESNSWIKDNIGNKVEFR